MHLDNVKVYYSPKNAQVIVLKTISKFHIKIAPTCSHTIIRELIIHAC